MFYESSDIVKEIITPTIRLRLLKNTIIHYTFLHNVVIDIEEHTLNHKALLEIATIKQHPLLIDAVEFVNLNSDTRKYIRSLEPKTPILARAIVTESLPNRLLISFYKKINKPIYPQKIFKNYTEAEIWLLNLPNQNLII